MYITHLKSGSFVCSKNKPEFILHTFGGQYSVKMLCGFVKEGKVSYLGETTEANDIWFDPNEVVATFEQKDF